MNYNKSKELFEKASQHLVGGVNSPVRAFKSVGGTPLFISKGEGAYIEDVDGNRFVDYVGSYGPLILGHKDPEVQEAIIKALENGTTFGASTENEIILAELVKEAFPGIDKVRFVNSGTEAVMSTIRLARAFTKKNKIIKFAGCYHGHSDFLLAAAGSGLLTLSLPGSAGVPEAVVKDTIIVPYNDIEAVGQALAKYENEIAAVLVEPVPGNMGLVLPEHDFLKKLRELTSANNILLIFDEVMSGFRQCFGGAQHYYNIRPDITCLGKIIGGGMPVGAYGARAEIMDMVAPLGPVYQAGTLSGNPIAMAAGISTLNRLKNPDIYKHINNITALLADGIRHLSDKLNTPLQVAVFGSMITPFFAQEKVTDYTSALKSDTEKFARFFWTLIHNGIYPPPSQFETWFVSARHTEAEVDKTLAAFEEALAGAGR
jgi:glutamate-1-semialdehyde 2,1-aminomutase